MICRNVATNPALRNSDFFRHLISKSPNLAHLTQTHAQIILNGLQTDVITITKLAQKLSDFNSIRHASLLCHTFPKPDIFLFNVLIRAYSHNKNPLSAISTYAKIRKTTILKPDNFTYAFILSALDDGLDERLGLLLHCHSVVDGYGSDVFVGSAVVDWYFKFSRVGLALKVFDGMPDRDTVLWNTVISGLARNCAFTEAMKIFMKMLGEGAVFDSATLATVLPAAAELQEMTLGKGIQCLALKIGVDCHAHVLTGLVSLYSKCGDCDTAEYLFGQILRPDLISCNAMISGYTCNHDTESAVGMFKELLHSRERVNSSTLVGLIPVHSPFGFLNLTYSIHAFSLKSGVVSNPSVSTAMTTVYSRLNEIEPARKLFDDCPEKTLAGWNAMISGYTQNGLTEKAITLFQQMQGSDVRPNHVTVTSMLSACAQLGALTLGKWVHDVIIKEKLEMNVYVSTALIDMYAKCGSISYARQLFDSMPDKNVVTWNAMISGYGLHGHGQEAVTLLNEMSASRVLPTEVTFVCALYACSHTGLVKEGNDIFRSMVHDYGLKPLSEHYACMVDIFGRAGQLNKAMEFIEGMPVEPGPAVWGTMLGACMIHKDKKLARIASDKLFEFEGEGVGYYVLLSNIYSSERSYAEAASVRQLAKKKQLAKTPGCTLIEIGGTPHVFTSGDRSHPQSDAIYEKLESLLGKMREAGFQTETVTALHDIEEEEKEISVKVHSEKLAIAFGLISSEPGTEIRIIKNLRVCVDCHTATKFISKVTERIIVVRDGNRFHHFREGMCSCGDYW
uniref:DYW domain-containing protein n=1 Tax=Kalanchoe fedtschenkoi TaxID=63787 RepID=A0A7N0RGH7_KALFE